MNTKATLNEIKALINKAQAMLDAVIEAQPKQTPGKPPQPRYGKRVERKLWNAWDKLKAKGQFSANTAYLIANDQEHLPTMFRIDSFYSAILSRWSREGFIERIRRGRGPLPAIYKVPN
jgi:acyl-CoA-binding protein